LGVGGPIAEASPGSSAPTASNSDAFAGILISRSGITASSIHVQQTMQITSRPDIIKQGEPRKVEQVLTQILANDVMIMQGINAILVELLMLYEAGTLVDEADKSVEGMTPQ